MRMNQTVVSSMVVASQYAKDRGASTSSSLRTSGLGSFSDAATPSIVYRCMSRYQSTASQPDSRVNAVREIAMLDTPGTVDTPRAVISQTPSTPDGLGFGATTQGWRPISVKIHPNEDARNGVAIAAMPSVPNHFLSVTRPLRVSHSE